MKEITLTFSPEELRELAKLVRLGIMFTCDTEYDNEAVANELFNRICAMGLAYAPETGAFMKSGPLEDTMFCLTDDVEEEMMPLIELFEDWSIQSRLPGMLSYRDFTEQYGVMEPEEVLKNPELLNALFAIEKKYIQEISTYNVTHLRLEERG